MIIKMCTSSILYFIKLNSIWKPFSIDSCIMKLKNNLISGWNATLIIKSNAGNAEVILNVDRGQVPPPHVQHQHHSSRDRPSRKRHRLRRTEAHISSKAEEASQIVEEAKTAAQASRAKENEIVSVQIEHETLRDEFCSDETFENKAACTSEKERDAAWVDKILVTADCQADWNDVYVIKLMDEKLKTIRIKMKTIIVNRNERKSFESCLIMIEPTSRTVIYSESFPIRRWIAFHNQFRLFLPLPSYFEWMFKPQIEYNHPCH